MAISPICLVDDCAKPARAQGFCSAHYQRWKRHGDARGGRTSPGEPRAFLENTVLAYEGAGCLIWPYAKIEGYGIIRDPSLGRTAALVSRIVCETENGPPPTPEHEAAHSCGKGHEGCVSRHHLSWKTHAENEADKLVHGTHRRGEYCNAKLTEDQVRSVRQRLAAGEMQMDIAADMGVSKSTVSLIFKGEVWGWLD